MDELVRPPGVVVVNMAWNGTLWVASSEQLEGFGGSGKDREAVERAARETLGEWLDPAVTLKFRTIAVFTPAGITDGIPLYAHACSRYRNAAYVSAAPSGEDDFYAVPGCGCRPAAGNGAS